jgi:hypothetical protein
LFDPSCCKPSSTAKLLAVADVDREVAAAESIARLDHLIDSVLSRLKVIVHVLEMASDRLGPLWQDRLATVREALLNTSRRANTAAVTGIFRLPSPDPIAAPNRAIFRRKSPPPDKPDDVDS